MNITNRQLYFLILVLILPFVICFLPQVMAVSFGTGAWIFIIVTALFYSVFAGLIAFLGYKNQDKTLFEYSQPIVGKFLTYCFSAVFFVEFFIYTALLTRAVSEIIHTEVMVRTPRWFVCAVFIAASYYVVSKGMTNLGRAVEIVGIIVVIIALTLHSLMASQGDIINIKPFFNFSNPQKYISMIPIAIYLFAGFEIMTIIPFTKRNGFKVIGTAMLAVLSTGAFYIMVVESCFLILGVEDSANYVYPLIVAMRRIDINLLQFLKRIDLVFIVTWLMFAFFNICIALLVTVEYARKMIHKPNNNVVLIVICILAYIVSLLPQSETIADEISINTAIYLSPITNIVIPVTLLITEKVKKHEKNVPNQS